MVELDQEKSKIGLAEIYEQEVTYFIFKKHIQIQLFIFFFQKVFKQTGEIEQTDELTLEHQEIDKLFKQLCTKLDAL